MATPIASVLHQLRKAVAADRTQQLSERDLLERFAGQRDEQAFAALVERHGGLVMGVCRRILQHTQEAEDAFQATFMVLARKASGIRRSDSVAAWLYGVASRLALKARVAASRRRRHEGQAAGRPPQKSSSDVTWHEVQHVLDEELQHLPEKYRAPLLLCYLEGKTQDEAARVLGWKVGQLRGRLDRGRQKLRERLHRRGLSLSAGLFATALAQEAQAAPALLLTSTATAALSFSAQAGPTSSPAMALALGMLHAMVLAKVKATLAIALAGCLFAVGATMLAGLLLAEKLVDGVAAKPAALPTVTTQNVMAARTDLHGDPLPPGAVARLGTIRLRPGGRVQFLSYSPDGKQLVSCGNGFSIWETATGREVRHILLPDIRVRAARWLADGKGVAVLELGDGSFCVWDFVDPRAQLPSHIPRPGFGKIEAGQDVEQYSCFAIAPNGKLLAAGKRGFQKKERAVHVWELASGRCLHELKGPRLLGRQPENCDALTFSPDSSSLLAFSGRPLLNAFTASTVRHQRLVLWDVADGKQRKQATVPLPVMQGTWQVHAPAPDGKTVVLGMPDGTARIWDLAKGKEIRSIPVVEDSGLPYRDVSAVPYTPDGGRLHPGRQTPVIRERRQHGTGLGCRACRPARKEHPGSRSTLGGVGEHGRRYRQRLARHTGAKPGGRRFACQETLAPDGRS